MGRTPRKWNLEDLPSAVADSYCMVECLRRLNIRTTGGNSATVKKYIKEMNLNTDHWDPNKNRKQSTFNKITDDSIIFCKPSVASKSVVKRRLQEIRPKKECNICGQGLTWNGKYLTLHLDHIDGDTNNNLLENLRWICPNCHSQTETYSGKQTTKKVNYIVCGCGNLMHKNSKKCMKCTAKTREKINWPNNDVLHEMVNELGYTKTGKQLGVSDNAVRKRLDAR